MPLCTRTLVRIACWVMLIALVGACKPARRPPPPPVYGAYGPPFAAPTPFVTTPPPPQPAPTVAAPDPTVEPAPPAPATKLVGSARPTLGVSTVQDETIVLFSVQGEKGYLGADDPRGSERLELDQLRFTVEIGGAQSMTLTASKLPASGSGVALHSEPGMALRIDDKGVAVVPWMNQVASPSAPVAPWQSAPRVAPFSVEGEYEVKISVELPFAAGAVTVSAEPFTVQRRIRGRSTTTLREIEKIAQAAAVIHLNKIGRAADAAELKPSLLSVDVAEANHQRLVRFWLPEQKAWTLLFLEVVVERNGTVVKVNQQERFSCIAEGTRVDTEGGAVLVENLKPGDRVWSWDLARRRRVLSEVVAVTEPRPANTMLIGGKLRVTGNHPVRAGGAWVPAQNLKPGMELVAEDGRALALSAVVADYAPRQVFDISVTAPHNFFAEGFLVHNKRLQLPPARLDPSVVLWERAEGVFDLLDPARP